MACTANEQRHAQQLAPVTIHMCGDSNGRQLMVSASSGQQQQAVTGGQKEAALADAGDRARQAASSST
ncbi:hypothetical protein E4188_23845 (plasmid) [Aeromonas media]|uniref:DUF4124 domain-containing protein n=3 Tax=Aeromonas TaxID=642 RepID=A0ABX6P1V3_AERME|nr:MULTISPECIES: hypothetical protein [Aeromonas]ASI21446.1 hypothetical protein CE456_00955 [Aeromonas salmonicida]QJT41525.1 hypothetical protein E4188_23845 [Aeromonas media]QLI59074.1 hypothetical protein C0708_23285 [Aeromonas caviae]QLI60302.1 hypothetical protein C1C91_22935 [Aeromonas caviae]HDN9373729.1 hypothetical protein [Aeromonas salmonicida]